MSEAEKAKQNSEVYLKEVRLQNYKSIIDTTIDFKPGLNIIIGNNGSGKTNFLNYLYDVVHINWDRKSELAAEFILAKKSNLYRVVVSKSSVTEMAHAKTLDNIINNKKKPNVKVFKNNILKEELEIAGADFNFNIGNSTDYYIKLLQYGIPREQNIIEKPVKLSFSSTGIINSDINSEGKRSEFVESLISKTAFSIVFYEQEFDIHKVKTVIIGLNDFFNNLKEELKGFTTIENLRISPNFNIYYDEDKNQFDVHNLYLEYYVNNNWLPYLNLSDGNKRLFYLVSEVIAYHQIEIFYSLFDDKNSNRINPSHIILLEEPELGIHPHQLHKLMLFIKEQSREKQIILTTHSPQVLNILGSDELDRIIICSYDQQKGTQLRHLTEKETQKAQRYMQEDFLSDYWIHSDLEPVI